MTHVGQYLRKCRIEYGLTQLQVGIELNYDSAQFISNVERGVCAPSTHTLESWCQYVGADKKKILKLMTLSYTDRMAGALGL